jgi:hypothetical protein
MISKIVSNIVVNKKDMFSPQMIGEPPELFPTIGLFNFTGNLSMSIQ